MFSKSLILLCHGVSRHGVTVFYKPLILLVTVLGGCVSPYPYTLRCPAKAGAEARGSSKTQLPKRRKKFGLFNNRRA